MLKTLACCWFKICIWFRVTAGETVWISLICKLSLPGSPVTTSKVPNSKLQVPNKFQAPSLKRTSVRTEIVFGLELGIWSFFGVWNLELGTVEFFLSCRKELANRWLAH